MNSTQVVRLSTSTLESIMSVIEQMTRNEEYPNEFCVIRVWFADVANKYLKSNTPPEGFAVYYAKEGNYSNPEVIAHAKAIWKKGLVPVEVIQMTGAFFYALPQDKVKNHKLRDAFLLRAEEHIPDVVVFE